MGRRTPSRELVIGRVVHYESKDFECPAMVVATIEDSDQFTGNPPFPYQPVLDDTQDRVHLMVFDPSAATVRLELNIPHDPDIIPETYHWPDECEAP